MKLLAVLVVEDEPFISMTIKQIVEDTVAAEVTVSSTVRETERLIEGHFDLALLDIDLTNGHTLNIARRLDAKRVRYAFVTGWSRNEIPDDLRSAPHVRKPFSDSEIADLVLNRV